MRLEALRSTLWMTRLASRSGSFWPGAPPFWEPCESLRLGLDVDEAEPEAAEEPESDGERALLWPAPAGPMRWRSRGRCPRRRRSAESSPSARSSSSALAIPPSSSRTSSNTKRRTVSRAAGAERNNLDSAPTHQTGLQRANNLMIAARGY